MARGRPKKEIDVKEFEKLCALQCTLEEIAGWFDCCEDTIENWCKSTYKRNFSEVYAQKRGKGKISLRRAQFRLAETNASMAIWLGKQYLGQTDEKKEVAVEVQDSGFLEAISGTIDRTWSDSSEDTDSSV